jgi:ribonucleoside-diphosphate reductase alpha subunit
LSTLKNGYMLSVPSRPETQERPQDMWMRVSLFLNMDNIDAALKSYNMMSTKQFTHATPTLFHAGLKRSQMLSCFLMGMDDSINGIFDTVKDAALVSKWSGGIGLHVSNVRSSGSWVKGTGMQSPGIVPMLQVLNQTIGYLNKNNKRHSSVAIYLEPWHADIFDFLEIRTNTGDQSTKCRELFTSLWMPDLFMEHVRDDRDWYLFSPSECPGLAETWGKEFESLYYKYVFESKHAKKIKARELWKTIVKSQAETGTPYIVYKDACNAKSNQKFLGTIRSSNLCAEIVQYSDSKDFSCCTLASMGLPAFVKAGEFDFDRFRQTVRQVVRNLDRVIDLNFYPVERTKQSNLDYRPLGIGVQGLIDVFQELEIPTDSKEAAALNTQIFEHLYYAAVESSCELAQERGAHKDFDKSPAAKGVLSFDMWDHQPVTELDWPKLKLEVMEHGLRNSLLVACMPTASTSQILGNTECFEPPTSNIFTRRTLHGEFMVVNLRLMRKLKELGIWSQELREEIVRNRGSIQNIKSIPENVRAVFKTSWDLKQKTLIDLAAGRGPYVDQSQSLNLFLEKPTAGKLNAMHMYAWKQGLKTGIYYLRTKGAAHAQMFTIERGKEEEEPVCDMCSA